MIRVGESAYLLELGRSGDVLAACATLDAWREPAIAELVPGATTLLVVLANDEQACALDAERLAAVERAVRGGGATDPARGAALRRHEVAVRYDGADLAEVAARAGLAVPDLVARHAAIDYRVAFVGFQPGFAYLDGLPAELHAPRRTTPRPRVPAGSVAIGGEWTGIYPLASPGGWNLLGTTDVTLFDPRRTPPALLEPGDVVRFVPR